MSPIKVLLIEDNPGDTRLFGELLRTASFGAPLVLSLAATLDEGIALSMRQDVDVVFLDLGLPDSQGLGTYERLHRIRPNVPVLILTGMSDEELALQAVHAGAQDYLVKGEVTGNVLARAARYAIERKKTEAALRESEERFRLFFENVPEYCYMLAPEGVILDVNSAAVRALGYEKQDLVGNPVLKIYAPECRQKAVALLERRSEAGNLENEEMVIQTRSGEKRTVLLSAGTIRLHDDATLSTVSIQHDVTELKRLEEQLRQAQKVEAIGRLAGGVAHDFNNLLGIITGYGEVTRQALPEGHVARKHVDQILAAAQRAARLTRQLLLFSRRHPIETRVLDLNGSVRELEPMLRRLIGEDIDLLVRTSTQPATVNADPGQIEQLLMNLVVNARDAMEHGGSLGIAVSAEHIEGRRAWHDLEIPRAEYAILEVADTGSGMEEETLAHLFEPLFTTKAEGKGTGLGLSTVLGIVRSHEGYVEVTTRVGEGTTFRVYLPRAGPVIPAESLDPAATGDLRGDGAILLVEDEAALREIIAESLGAYGYTVMTSAGGEEALEKAATMHALDVLITDVVMPVMNGVDLADRLSRIKPGLRTLFISGYTDDAIQQRARAMSSAGFLDKPFTPRALALKVKQTLQLPAYNS